MESIFPRTRSPPIIVPNAIEGVAITELFSRSTEQLFLCIYSLSYTTFDWTNPTPRIGITWTDTWTILSFKHPMFGASLGPLPPWNVSMRRRGDDGRIVNNCRPVNHKLHKAVRNRNDRRYTITAALDRIQMKMSIGRRRHHEHETAPDDGLSIGKLASRQAVLWHDIVSRSLSFPTLIKFCQLVAKLPRLAPPSR